MTSTASFESVLGRYTAVPIPGCPGAAALATGVLRAIGSESWQRAFALALAVLGVRIAVMAWGAVRRALPASRLLLPAILFLEGAALSRYDSAVLWQVRLGMALALELAFVVVAIRELRRAAAGTEPLEARMPTSSR